MTEARAIDALCRRYGCLPSALMREDVSLLYNVRLLALASEGA